MPDFQQGDRTKAHRVYVPNIIHTTMGLFYAILTEIVSRPSAIGPSSENANQIAYCALNQGPYVACWHKTDMQAGLTNVRCWGMSRRSRTFPNSTESGPRRTTDWPAGPGLAIIVQSCVALPPDEVGRVTPITASP